MYTSKHNHEFYMHKMCSKIRKHEHNYSNNNHDGSFPLKVKVK